MRNPYPDYRHSDVDWLGDIPEHWEAKRLAHSVRRSDVRIEPEEAQGVPFVGLEHISSWTGDLLPLDDEWASESLSNSFSDGDILFAKLRPYLAKAFLADFDGLCSTEFLVLEAVDHSPEYLLYLLLTDGFVSIVDSSTYGAKMPRASWDCVRGVHVPVPTVGEQRAIAAFLDDCTERIDALVARKRLLLERLAEYRTALITRAVTRGLPPQAARAAGLDPSPPLKPSSVDWLGDIPEHWDTCQLRHLLREPLAYGASEPADSDDPNHPRYIRITDIDEMGLLKPDTFRSLQPEVAAQYLLKEGDLLLARSGSVGKAFLYEERWGPCAFAGYLIRARFDRKRTYAPFMKHFAESDAFSEWLESTFIQSTIQNVSADRYAAMRLAVPPVGEQRAIAAFLDERTERIDRLCSRVEEAIERLHEYRTALVVVAIEVGSSVG